MSSYARTGEALWYWLGWYEYDYSDPTWSGLPLQAEWVGPSPRLAAADELTAAATIYTDREGFYDGSAAVFFAPAAIDEQTRVKVQVRSRGDLSNLSVYTALPDGSSRMLQYIEAPADEWTTIELMPLAEWAVVDSWASQYAGLVADAPTEGFMVVVAPDYFSDSPAFDVSLIEVLGGRPIPLRWRNRNDGLSGGPKQARGVSSQQVGRQHRGYL